MLIHNPKLIPWRRPNEILDDQALLLADGFIADLGSSLDLLEKYPHEERLDATG
jgi:hypothetical protein